MQLMPLSLGFIGYQLVVPDLEMVHTRLSEHLGTIRLAVGGNEFVI